MRRSAIKRKRIPRYWTDAQAKVQAEGKCRWCGRDTAELRKDGRRLNAAHLIGRGWDVKGEHGVRYVHPDSVVPLCGPPTTTATCHAQFDGHYIDLWPKLKPEEAAWCIGRAGEGLARRRISGRAYMKALARQ